MLTRLPIKHKEYFDCVDCTLANMFDKFKVDYQQTFINCFGFEYAKSNMLSDSIITSNKVPMFEVINQYTQLEFRTVNVSTPLLRQYLLDICRQDVCIGVISDAFYLPWTDFYKMYHRGHNLLLDVYDTEKELVYIYDLYLKPERIAINYIDFTNSIECFFYLMLNQKKVTYKPSLSGMKLILMELPQERKAKLTEFKEAIINEDYSVYHDMDISSSVFLFYFKNYIGDKLKAIDYLTLLQEVHQPGGEGVLIELKKKIQSSISLWETLCSLIIKNMIVNKIVCKEKITWVLDKITVLEMEILLLINSF